MPLPEVRPNKLLLAYDGSDYERLRANGISVVMVSVTA